MSSSRRSIRLIVIALLCWTASTAVGRTVRVPLPELLGPQSINSLDSNLVFSLGRSVEISLSSLPTHSEFIGFEWSGTIKAGRVVGDGIEREPIEQILRGNFSTGLSAPGRTYASFPSFALPPYGSFQALWQLHGPIGEFFDPNCIDCVNPRDTWEIGLQLVPDYFALGNSIPFLEPAGEMEFRLAQQGLILLEGIEADVVSAGLVFNVIPEPSTTILVLIGSILVVVLSARCRPIMCVAV